MLEALSLMRSLDFPSGVITTIVKRNLRDLTALRDVLLEGHPCVWQLQIGSAMGSLAGHREEWLEPRDTLAVLDLAAQVARETSLIVDLADCVGYYTVQEREAGKKRSADEAIWAGCSAGKRGFGIRHNGDISACNAIRDASSIEGNIRRTALRDIWTRPDAFHWHRTRTQESLTGLCRLCQFSALCLAGCTSVRRSLSGSDGEYTFCAYRLALEPLFAKIDAIGDPATLVRRAERAVALDLPDVASRCLTRALAIDSGHQPAAIRLAAVTAQLERIADASTYAHTKGDRPHGC